MSLKFLLINAVSKDNEQINGQCSQKNEKDDLQRMQKIKKKTYIRVTLIASLGHNFKKGVPDDFTFMKTNLEILGSRS